MTTIPSSNGADSGDPGGQSPKLLSLRSALIFVIAFLVAAAAGALAVLAGHSVPEACIAAGAAFAVTLPLANNHIDA